MWKKLHFTSLHFTKHELRRHKICKRTLGFTLIEISIVLVIIGLVIGGILVGRDLIKFAEVKNQITQLSEFNIATNLFKDRYGYLPGDLPHAENFNMYDCTSGITAGLGNGNGWINGGNSLQDNTTLYCEPIRFFQQLSQANLLRGYSFMSPGEYSVDDQFPRVKLGERGGIAAGSNSNLELVWFLGITNTNKTVNYCGTYLTCSTYKIFTPQEAYSLDKKLDDGKPKTGFITNTTTPAVDDTTANSCITSVANNTYNITNTDNLCSLLVKEGK